MEKPSRVLFIKSEVAGVRVDRNNSISDFSGSSQCHSLPGLGRITCESNHYNYNYFQNLQLQITLSGQSNEYNYNYFEKVINYFSITFNYTCTVVFGWWNNAAGRLYPYPNNFVLIFK